MSCSHRAEGGEPPGLSSDQVLASEWHASMSRQSRQRSVMHAICEPWDFTAVHHRSLLELPTSQNPDMTCKPHRHGVPYPAPPSRHDRSRPRRDRHACVQRPAALYSNRISEALALAASLCSIVFEPSPHMNMPICPFGLPKCTVFSRVRIQPARDNKAGLAHGSPPFFTTERKTRLPPHPTPPFPLPEVFDGDG